MIWHHGNNIRSYDLSAVFILFGIIFVLLFLNGASTKAQSAEDCMLCHEDTELTKTGEDGEEISLYVDLERFQISTHGVMECTDCHQDLMDADFPHAAELERVECGFCHDGISEMYEKSLHGQAVAEGARLAPQCWDCHGDHYIVPVDSSASEVTKFNIPFVCGSCHKEGTPVTQTYDIHEDSIITHYSQSIHGVGLYQQGLTVTAVCTDCHTSHNVLKADNPESSIHRMNIAGTCQQCHGRIQEVHKKVIRGELWEKEPDKVPVCVDCHAPHEIRRVIYEEGMSDKECMRCHGKQDLMGTVAGDTVSMYVDTGLVYNSMHKEISCAQCHTGATPNHPSRPCATVINEVDCSICHAEVVETYSTSTHGILEDRGDPDAPDCNHCHGTHGVMGRKNPKSPTYPRNVPALCAECHAEGEPAAVRHKTDLAIIETYRESVHGIGLVQSGLVVTAMCTDCHTAHHVLPRDNPESSVNPENIPETCAECHNGIYEQFITSIHSPAVSDTEEQLPTCEDCHTSHAIMRTDKEGFRNLVIDQCGHCHEDVTDTYFETFHGKVSKLGYEAAARCHDCHGAHNILPTYDPQSTLSRQNIVETCGQCHEGSHRQFAGYLTHATHHDKDKYPILYYTFWFMTTLLLVTFVVAGTHTILWLPRSFQAMRRHKKIRRQYKGNLQFQRFTPLQRRLHILVIISFLGLAITGMTIKFSYLGWAQWISDMLGGFESAGYIHRVCAIITFFYFFAHIYDLIKKKRRSRQSWKEYLFDGNTMIPTRKDLKDVKDTFKWFIGLGPRPKYGKWTYWEKFDYFAVFWGVGVIGLTGLILWFPEFFTLFLPGWIINVATIVHSDEALLAAGFIFTVHFFNTHFRPDKFPMDPVIFSGTVPVEEYKEDRPHEYERLVENRELKKKLTEPTPDFIVRALKIFGGIALVIGLTLIVLIIYAEIFGYR